MGWFWGGAPKKEDPTDSLPPDLKEFLTTQEPRPYTPTSSASETSPTLPKLQEDLPDTNKTFENRSLPKESLFQDGRYKDIWKTYVPEAEIGQNTLAPIDRIVERRKERRQATQHAAWENCAFEQEMQLNCLQGIDTEHRVRARMTLCREEIKAFNRCFQLQSKFLQSLGYYSSPTRSEEDEERIQMHGDKLYHRMMDYEAAVDEAKKTGAPIPPLSSIFDASKPAPSIDQLSLPQHLERRLKTPLHELPPHQRELAVQAALEEAKMRRVYAEDFTRTHITTNKDRQARQEKLIKFFGEPIGKFIIPDPPRDFGESPSQDDQSKRRTVVPAASKG